MNPPEFSLGRRSVGLAHPPLVVAEIGINHGGSLEVAVAMVDAAVSAGVEIVERQTLVVCTIVTCGVPSSTRAPS